MTLGFALMTPWVAAAGLGLAAIPIIIHILNRRRFKTVTWAAMEYLLRAMRKNRRRLRFEQMILLITRCLVLALLGLALARPVGCANSAMAALGRRSALNVYIVDNSYSMAFEADRPDAKTHLAQAKRIVDALLDQPSSGSISVAVIAAAQPAKLVVAKPTYDLQNAKAAIDRIEQSYDSTDLVGALQAALQIARDETRQPEKNLYILTDGTRSALEGGQAQALKQLAPELSKAFNVTLYNLGKDRTQWNAAVTDLRSGAALTTSKFPTDFKAVVQGFGAAHDADVRWRLDDQLLPGGGATHIDGEVSLTQSQAVFHAGGPHVLTISLGNSDKLAIDNTRYRVVDVASQLKTLIVEGKHGIGPLEGSAAFIANALAAPLDAKGTTNSYIAPDLVSDLDLGAKVLGDYRLIVLADVGQFTGEEADRLKRFVEAGGALMYFTGDSVNKDNYNSMLLPRKLIPGPIVKLVTVGSEHHGYTFDFNPDGVLHPLLSAFAHQADTGLDRAQVFSYWQVDPGTSKGVETVLRYVAPDSARTPTTRDASGTPDMQTGDPAIMRQTLGQGTIVFVSTLANKEWSNLPAHPNFTPLLHELVLGTARGGDFWMNLQVGQRLVIPASVQLAGTPLLTDAAQTPVPLESPNPSSTTVYEQTYHSAPLAKPGVYSLSLGASSVPIAVNVPAAAEANVFTVSDSTIRQDMGDLQMEMLGDQPPGEASAVAAARQGNDFSWWCMAGVLLLVGVECFMAMSFGHQRKLPAVAS